MADHKTPLGQMRLLDALPRFSSYLGAQGIKRAFDAYYMKYVKPANGAVFWHFWTTFALVGYAASRTKHHAQHPHKYANN